MSRHHFMEELRRHYTTRNAKYRERFPETDPPEIHKHALVFPLTLSERRETKEIASTRIDNVPEQFTGRLNPLISAETHPLLVMPEIELLLLSMLACSLPPNTDIENIQEILYEYWSAMFTIFRTCVDEIKLSTCHEISKYRLEYKDHNRFVYLIPTADVNYPKSRFYAYPHLWSVFATIFGPKYKKQPSFYFTVDTPQIASDVHSSGSKSPSPRHSPKREASLPHPSERIDKNPNIPPDVPPRAPTPAGPDVARTLIPERLLAHSLPPNQTERENYDVLIAAAVADDADYDRIMQRDLARAVQDTATASLNNGQSPQQQAFVLRTWTDSLNAYTEELANLREIKLPIKRAEAVDAAVAVDRFFNAPGSYVPPPAEAAAIAQRMAAIEQAVAPLREENRLAALTEPIPNADIINTTQGLIRNMLNAHFRRRYGILKSADRLDVDDTRVFNFSDLILPQNASLTLATYCVRNNVPIRYFSPAPTATATFEYGQFRTIELDAEVDFSLVGFTTAPTVRLQNRIVNPHLNYRPAVAVAHIENGRLVRIEVTDAGFNCHTTPTVIISNDFKLNSDAEKAIHEKIKNVLLTSICEFFWTEMYRERDFMPPLTRNGCQNETQLAHYDSNISDAFQVGYFPYQLILRDYSTYLESLCLYHVRESADSLAGLDPQQICIICNDIIIADLKPPPEGTIVKSPWQSLKDKIRFLELGVDAAEKKVIRAQAVVTRGGTFSDSEEDLPHSNKTLDDRRRILAAHNAELALLPPPQEIIDPALQSAFHRKLCTYNCGCRIKPYMHPMCLFKKLETNAANMNNILPSWRLRMSTSVKCLTAGYGACDMRFMYKDCLHCDGEHHHYLDTGIDNIKLHFPPVRLFEVTMETDEQTLTRIRERTIQEVVDDVVVRVVEDQPLPQAPTAGNDVDGNARPRPAIFRFGPLGAHIEDMPETHTCDTISSLLHETPATDTDELLFPLM
jgi:hypothetical protein